MNKLALNLIADMREGKVKCLASDMYDQFCLFKLMVVSENAGIVAYLHKLYRSFSFADSIVRCTGRDDYFTWKDIEKEAVATLILRDDAIDSILIYKKRLVNTFLQTIIRKYSQKDISN